MPANLEREIVLEQLGRIGLALSNPKRLQILGLLGHVERTVEQLADALEQSHAATSAQLKVLREARLVASRREGKHVWYRLRGPEVQRLQGVLLSLGEAVVPEVREVLRALREEPGTLDGVDLDDLLRRVDEGTVVLLDLRPPEEFRAGHLPGAQSIPFTNLDAHLADLPNDREIVAYCRGPWCLMAREGVRRLRERGFAASRLMHAPTTRTVVPPQEPA